MVDCHEYREQVTQISFHTRFSFHSSHSSTNTRSFSFPSMTMRKSAIEGNAKNMNQPTTCRRRRRRRRNIPGRIMNLTPLYRQPFLLLVLSLSQPLCSQAALTSTSPHYARFHRESRCVSFAEPLTTRTTATTSTQEPEVNGAASPLLLPINEKDSDAFSVLAGRVAICLFESELRRNAIGKAHEGRSASGASNWIDDASAMALEQVVDQVEIKLPQDRTGVDRDDAAAWMRWMKAVPSPGTCAMLRWLDTALDDKIY